MMIQIRLPLKMEYWCLLGIELYDKKFWKNNNWRQ